MVRSDVRTMESWDEGRRNCMMDLSPHECDGNAKSLFNVHFGDDIARRKQQPGYNVKVFDVPINR